MEARTTESKSKSSDYWLQLAAIVCARACFCWSAILGYVLLTWLLFTPYYFLTFLYLWWMYYDRNTSRRGGRRSKLFHGLPIWKYYAEYFPAKTIKTADLDPNRNYLFCYHPHGIYTTGAFGTILLEGHEFSKLYPGLNVRIMTLNAQFFLPFTREICLLGGGISCDRESAEYALTEKDKGQALVVSPGGAAEALDAYENKMILTLKKRKGFVRLAIKTGTSLVPIICFGENELFTLKKFPPDSWVVKLQTWVKDTLGPTFPICHGRGLREGSTGLYPYKRPLTVVIGAPIEVPKESKPSEETVTKLHETYMAALVKLFEDHKKQYASDPNMEIVFK